jgi:hypothetical protein
MAPMMDLAKIEARVRAVVAPLAPADSSAGFWGARSDAGRSLPPYYLVYFLLVQLLRFNDLGRFEKVSFSIPVEIDGTILMVDHRKFGLGIFIKDPADEKIAEEVAKRIHAGVKAAQPYFESLADDAAKGSDLNVENNGRQLFERFQYFADCYAARTAEGGARKSERTETDLPPSDVVSRGTLVTFPAYDLQREARWYATAAIEAFYSWTEHVFILAAILKGKIATGEEVAKAAGIEWKEKFKLALSISDPATKQYYDRLTALRSQVRNFVAHGAFGKDGQALAFHSAVGAVPLLLPHRARKEHFRFGNGVDLVPPEATQLIHDFIAHMWSGDLAPAKIYIEAGLPLILSHVGDGMYAKAMASEKEMTEFTDHLSSMFDNAANMDW